MSAFLVNCETKDRLALSETTLIGRSKDSAVCLPDPRVSRQHAIIREQGEDEYWFYDLGSFNGSYINGQRVVTTQKLHADDTIRVAGFDFVFESLKVRPPLDEESGSYEMTISEIRTLPVIIFVSDIKGFTRLSERLSPDEVAQIIGTWYRQCNQVLSAHGAAIDKFIGDAVLAYWTDVSPESRAKALRAVRDMQLACSVIAQQHDATLKLHDLSFGSGFAIHLGPVALGQMSKGAFTMLGDAVNVGFRLQSLTRELKRDRLVSEQFLTGWPEGAQFCEPCGSSPVKGHSVPLAVHSVERFPA